MNSYLTTKDVITKHPAAMDDLDHSVLIAEQDWDCFYTESEECSIQQAELAALDDSGLSDTEDDKISTHVLSYPGQTTEEQNQWPEKAQKFVENSDLKNESAGQTCDTTLNKEKVTSEYFGLDHKNSNEGMEPPPLVTTNLKGNSESQGENKSSQADITSEASSLFWDANNENGTENAGTEVTDSLPLLRKEKERWFVTVNDSPVRMREKVVTSGQKKRRKKKTSRNGSQQSAPDRERRSSVNNTEYEKKTFERQSVRENFEKPPKRDSTDLISTTYLNNIHKENLLSNSHNIQDLQSSSSIEPTPDNLSHFINHTEEGSPSFILGASTTLSPANSQGERTAQQELLGQESSSQETACLESSSNRAQTPDETPGPTRPIFAMSSFWDEMEKWTIDDILELRIANNKPQLKQSFIPEEDDTLDTIDAHVDQVDSKDDNIEDSGLIDDAADSDYFTYLDDCKPDRSSCEFSTFSDYDKEFLQLCGSTNPSPVPCKSNEQTQTLLEPTCVRNLFQEDSDQILPSYQSESNEIVRMYPESDLPLFMYSEVESRTHDVLLKTTQDNIMSSFLIDHCDVRRSSPSPVLSISDVLDDQGQMSFFKILNEDKDSEQLQTRTNISISFPYLQNLSVPETYDNFFSEFEVGNFLFPSVKGTTQCEKNIVPIYSSSRSVVKDLTFPEVEEIIESDSEDESMPIRVVTHFSDQQKSGSPSGTPNLCFNTNQRNTWRNLSLRRIKFSFMGRTWCRMATSWGSQKNSIGSTAHEENWDISTTSNSSKAHPKMPVLLLEDQALQQSTDREIYSEQTVRGLGIERFCYSLKQADMCLVCIAFASWVLKSTNPQSTDMWKAALLANVSAISAIQYLRRYIKEEDEP